MMKKRIIMCLLIFILPIFSSCSKTNESDMSEVNFLSQIYEINQGLVYSFEELEEELTSYEINGQKLDISYKNTLYYPVGDQKMHYYAYSDSDNDYLLFDENGTLATICGYSVCMKVLGKVAMPQNLSEENVRLAVMTAVSQIIKLDNYDKWKLTENPNEDSGHYMFVFYNEVNGYTCDYVTVILYADGRILRVTSMNNELDYMNLNLSINENWENKLLLAKLKDMYNTNGNEYISHELHEKKILKYNDEICVQYNISVTTSDYGDRIYLFIPLSVLTT